MIPQIIKYFRFEPFTDSNGDVYMAPKNFKYGNNYYEGYDLEPFTVKYSIHKDNDLQPDTFVIVVDNYFFQNPTNNLKYISSSTSKLTDPLENFNPSVNHVIAIGPIPDDAYSWTSFGTESYCYEDHKEYLSDGPVFGFVKSWKQSGADKTEITCVSFLKVLGDYQSSTNFVMNQVDDRINKLQIYYEYRDEEDFSSSAYFPPIDSTEQKKDGRYRINPAMEQVDKYDKTPGFPKFQFFTGTYIEGYATSKIAWRMLQEIGWCREDYQTSASDIGATPLGGIGQDTTVGFINPFQYFSCADENFNPIIMGTDTTDPATACNRFQFTAFDTDGLRYEYPADTTGISGTELIFGEKYFLSFDPSKQSLLYNLKNLSDSDGLYINVTCCPRFIQKSTYNLTQFVWDFTPYESIENLKKWGVSVGFHPKILIKRNTAQIFNFDELITATGVQYPIYENIPYDFTEKYRQSILSSNASWSTARDAAIGASTANRYISTSTGYNIYRMPLVFDTTLLPTNARIDSATIYINCYNHPDNGGVATTIYAVGDTTSAHPISSYSQRDFNKGYYGNFDAAHTFGSDTSASGTGFQTLEISLNSYGLANIIPGGSSKFMLVAEMDYDDSTPVQTRGIRIASTSNPADIKLTVTYTIEGTLNNYLEQLNIMACPPLSYGAFNYPPASDYKTQVLVKGISWDKDQSDVINRVLVKYGQGVESSGDFIQFPFSFPLEYFFIVELHGSVEEGTSTVRMSIDYVDNGSNLQTYYINKEYPKGATSIDIVRDIINKFGTSDYIRLVYINNCILVIPLDDNNKTYWNNKYLEPETTWYTSTENQSPVTLSINNLGTPTSSSTTSIVGISYTKEFLQGEPLGFDIARESQMTNGIKTSKLSFPEVNHISDVMKISDKIFKKLAKEKYRCTVQCANSDNWQLPLFGLYNILDNTHTKRVVNEDPASVKFFISGSPTGNGYISVSIPSPYSIHPVGFLVTVTSGQSASTILTNIRNTFVAGAFVGDSIICMVDTIEGSITFAYDPEIVSNQDYKYKEVFNMAALTANVNGLHIDRIVDPPSQFKETTFNEYLHLLSYDTDSTKATYNCVFGVPNEDLANIVAQAINWIADVEKSQ